MEMSLDIYYFKRLNGEMKKRFGQKKRNTILEILQKNSDLLNIQWIYRGKKYYDFSSEELLNYVLLTGYYFKYKDLKSLCYAKTTKELINKLEHSKYGFLFKDEENFEFLMERNVERYIYQLFKDLEKVATLNINKSIGYMHKLEYEMRDIFTILESINYGLEVKEIQKKLVREVRGR
jgi:V/A-type H+-transporting ATPase subunit C